MSTKGVVILGSTGSIGLSSLDVVRHHPSLFRVAGLSIYKNTAALEKQIEEFSPETVVVLDEAAYKDLKKKFASVGKKGPKILFGQKGMEALVRMKNAKVVISGVVGASGLLPLVNAIKAGKTIGLANKEALVMAGDLIMKMTKKHKASLVPVDSEHSAIYQCLQGQNHKEIHRIVLTASGGPFYRAQRDLDSISVEEALKHPTWKMGSKITIDSATLMNKGLEAIEAHHLFNIPMEKISIVIHPQSIVHSMVEFTDGSVLAQLSHPDMRLPIQYAMTFPQRLPSPLRRLKLEEVGKLEFAEPDFSRFPCLKLALDAGKKGGTAPTVLSAANEVAVEAFLQKKISFQTIARVVEGVLNRHRSSSVKSFKQILTCDEWARKEARNSINSISQKSLTMEKVPS